MSKMKRFTSAQEKQRVRAKVQNILHHQKNDYMKKIASLLFRANTEGQEVCNILSAIREVFKGKFPHLAGKENGYFFRRTLEFEDTRQSSWFTPDPSQNLQIFTQRISKKEYEPSAKRIKVESIKPPNQRTEGRKQYGSNSNQTEIEMPPRTQQAIYDQLGMPIGGSPLNPVTELQLVPINTLPLNPEMLLPVIGQFEDGIIAHINSMNSMEPFSSESDQEGTLFDF